jgi:uncharacterized membrane protein
MQGLGALSANAEGISASGDVIVGTSSNIRPYRWTAQGGVQTLTGLLPDFLYGGAGSISGNGQIIAGYYQAPTHRDAFVWTQAAGMQALPTPNSAATTDSNAVSFDGSVIVGVEVAALSPSALFWRKQNGAYQVHRLAEFLSAAGVDITGWQLHHAIDVSDDGRRILGGDLNPQGTDQAFLVVLPVPEPASGSLALLMSLALRRQRSKA